MNERQTPKFKPKRKNRGAAVAAVLCFVAAIAIVGTYTFKDYRESQREIEQMELSQAKKPEQKEQTEKSANTLELSVVPGDETITGWVEGMCIYVHACVYHDTCVEVGFRLLYVGSTDQTPCQAWQPVPLPDKPS